MASSYPKAPHPTLIEVRDRMAARNDAHARSLGLSLGYRNRPVPVGALAGAIARDNAARVERSSEAGEGDGQEYARREIAAASALIVREVTAQRLEHPELATFLDGVDLFHAALREYFASSPRAPVRSKALESMRDAVASLERARSR